MKLEMLTLEMEMGDGAIMHLLLSQDMEKLEKCLDYLGTIDIGKELYLTQMPNPRYGWAADLSKETPTGGKCLRCGELVYHWAGEKQRRVKCACTIWILPLHTEGAKGAEKLSTQEWMWVVRLARKRLREWLRRQ